MPTFLTRSLDDRESKPADMSGSLGLGSTPMRSLTISVSVASSSPRVSAGAAGAAGAATIVGGAPASGAAATGAGRSGSASSR